MKWWARVYGQCAAVVALTGALHALLAAVGFSEAGYAELLSDYAKLCAAVTAVFLVPLVAAAVLQIRDKMYGLAEDQKSPQGMLWKSQWLRLLRRHERSPTWIRVGVAPIVYPAAFVLAAVCLCPYVAAGATVVIGVAYGMMLWKGGVTWASIAWTLGGVYILAVAMSYLAAMQHHSERLYDWLAGRQPERGDEQSEHACSRDRE